MDNNIVQELKQAQERWMTQMQLLQQLSNRLVSQSYDDTYVSAVTQAKACLARMSTIAEDFPGREPFGPGYRDACAGVRACLTHLQDTLPLLVKAQKAIFADGMQGGWEGVLRETTRQR